MYIVQEFYNTWANFGYIESSSIGTAREEQDYNRTLTLCSQSPSAPQM